MTDHAGARTLQAERRLPRAVRRVVVRPAVRLAHAIGAQPVLGITLAVGAAVAMLLAFLVDRVYDAVTEKDGVAALDKPILLAVQHLRSPVLDGFAAVVAEVFGPVGMPIMAVLALAALSLARRSWTPAILVAASGVGSLLMTVVGKDVIDRHRPDRIYAIPPFESSPSFPSGHTLNATVVAGIVGYLLWINRRTIAGRVLAIALPVVIAVVVGLTRVLLGAHWFTDVLAGWLLGAAWLAIVVTAHRLFLMTRSHGAPLAPPTAPGRS